MAIEKQTSDQAPMKNQSAGSNLVEVLDHVLDKGIVIDAWVAVSVIGIELVTIEARVVVASIDTYVKYAEILGAVGPIAGGLREPSKRKSLGEGIKDVQEGLGGLPLVGNRKEKMPQYQNQSRGTTTSSGKTRAKKGRTTRKRKKKK